MDKLEIAKLAKTYKVDEARVESTVSICEKLGIEPSGSVFYRTAEEIQAINDLCRSHGINPNTMKTCFKRPAKDVELIFAVCDKTRMVMNSRLFDLPTENLMESIVYVAKNHGAKYLKPHIVTRDVAKLRESMPYLKKLGLLEYVVTESAILELAPDEILERTAVILYLDRPLHKICRLSREDKLSNIYEYREEKYNRFIEEMCISGRVIKYKVEQLKEKLEEDESKK